jgi:hypothetical protein
MKHTKFLLGHSILLALVLQANVILALQYESEPNNDRAAANSIALAESLTGQLSSMTDEDWFLVNVSSASVLNVKFYVQNLTKQYTQIWSVNLEDGEGNVLAAAQYGGQGINESVDLSTSLSPGIYYVKIAVKFSLWSGSNYTLYAQCKTDQPEPTFSWKYLPGTLNQVTSGDFNADGKADLAGLTSAGQIYFTLDFSTWHHLPGTLAQITSGDFNGDGKGDLAGVTSTGQIYYTTDLQNWKYISGTLSQITSGDFDGDGRDEIAGVTSDGQIYYHLD